MRESLLNLFYDFQKIWKMLWNHEIRKIINNSEENYENFGEFRESYSEALRPTVFKFCQNKGTRKNFDVEKLVQIYFFHSWIISLHCITYGRTVTAGTLIDFSWFVEFSYFSREKNQMNKTKRKIRIDVWTLLIELTSSTFRAFNSSSSHKEPIMFYVILCVCETSWSCLHGLHSCCCLILWNEKQHWVDPWTCCIPHRLAQVRLRIHLLPKEEGNFSWTNVSMVEWKG